jgi:hypothetical protein
MRLVRARIGEAIDGVCYGSKPCLPEPAVAQAIKAAQARCSFGKLRHLQVPPSVRVDHILAG